MKEDMTDKQIQDFFENLDPSDFARDTSAVETESLGGNQSGASAFVRFVDAMIKGTMEGFNAQTTGELWQPTAVLQRSDTRRFFLPDDDETNQMFIQRLHREAEQMSAQWFFIATIGPVAVYRDIDEMVDDDGSHDIEAIMWYAESRESDFRHIRQGMISIDGLSCGINYEGDPEGAADMFKQVLRRESVT